MDFLREIRYNNPFNHILMILDNFSAHRTENVAITAEILDIELIFLPPYSPQLNPIEIHKEGGITDIHERPGNDG